MVMDGTKYSNSYKLRDIIAASIQNSPNQGITFAEYMDLALYHPQYGYYGSGTVGIGSQGDFFTSSSLGADFGELLGIQFAQMWHKLDCPRPFYIVEMGAGNGVLAKDILQYLSREYGDLVSSLEYIIVEQSPQLIVRQQKLLKSLTDINLSWKTWAEISDGSITGVFFANELVDAFPVHRIAVGKNGLEEIYLTIKDNKFTEIRGELSSSKIQKYLALLKIDLTDKQYTVGYETEVNLQALEWIDTIGKKLDQG